MKISIAMTTYNGEKYILAQLESFASQTRLPDEVVVTDDCSTDSTLEIIDNFKKNVPFNIRVFSNEINLGYAQNFNKVMQLCTGDLVFLSDQDDVWFPTKIEHLFNLTALHPDKELYMIDAELTDANLQESDLTKQGQIKGLGLSDTAFVMGCCIAVKKSFLDLVLPIPEGFSAGHDDWVVKIAEMLSLKYIDSSVQQYYRIHGENNSTFSANRLVKTKKTEITFSQKITNWWGFSKSTGFSNYIIQQGYLLSQLELLSTKQRYAQLAEKKVLCLKKDISSHEKRLDVFTSKNIVCRILKAAKLYMNNGYSPFSGYKSFISDVLHD